MLRCLDDRVDRAACGRLVSSFAATDRQRLAGDDRESGVPVMHRVRVHDPRHRLRVRVHVRCGDVPVRADEKLDLRRVATRERFELLGAHRLRVADDAALRAPVRDADDRALPGHPHRERLHLVEGDRRVVADAALPRAAGGVVLHAVPGEHLDDPVRHAHGEMHGELALGRTEDAPHVRVEVQLVGRDAELLERDLPRITLRVVNDRRRCFHEFLRAVMASRFLASQPPANHRWSCRVRRCCSNSSAPRA